MIKRLLRLAAAAFGLAGIVFLTTGQYLKPHRNVLLEANGRSAGVWQILRPWLDPPENWEDLGVSWGRFDCFRNGPAWESRALGCDRPGGCDAPIEPVVFESHLDECGDTSEVCVHLFKTCLLRHHSEIAAPSPADCNCYLDVIELGCTPECVDAVFRSYGEVSDRCHGFSVYTGCRYIDAHRPPEQQTFGMLKAESHTLLLQSHADPEPDMDPAPLEAAIDADPEPLQVDAGPVDAEPEMEGPLDMDLPLAMEDATGGVDLDLQFRQPAGTYVQEDMSGTLIEPWQYNSHAFDPRVDLPFDDDDPRE